MKTARRNVVGAHDDDDDDNDDSCDVYEDDGANL